MNGTRNHNIGNETHSEFINLLLGVALGACVFNFTRVDTGRFLQSLFIWMLGDAEVFIGVVNSPAFTIVVRWCCRNLSVLCTEHFQPAQSSSDLCYWHKKGDEFTFLTHSSAKKKKPSVLNVSLAKSVTIWENIWTGRCKCKTPDGAPCVPLPVRVYIFEYIYTHTYICMYIRVYMYMCMSVCCMGLFK